MDDHAGGLVDHQHVLVLIDDIQGNVLRKNLHPAALVGHPDRDHVVGTDDGIRLGRGVVQEHIAGLDGKLHPVPGSAFNMSGNEFINPLRRLAFVGDEAVMLEEILRYHFCGTLLSSVVRYSVMREPIVREERGAGS